MRARKLESWHLVGSEPPHLRHLHPLPDKSKTSELHAEFTDGAKTNLSFSVCNGYCYTVVAAGDMSMIIQYDAHVKYDWECEDRVEQ